MSTLPVVHFDAVAASPSGLTKLGLLSLLLTTEGLLFAALTVGVSLSARAKFAPPTVVPAPVLAFIAAGVIATVGAAAVLAWTDLFLGGHWPLGWNGRLEAIALLVAIAAQPLIALLIAVGIWRG
jgi:hypothetical protein